MLLIDALADIGIPQEECDIELGLLASQRACHCCTKRASTEHNNLHSRLPIETAASVTVNKWCRFSKIVTADSTQPTDDVPFSKNT